MGIIPKVKCSRCEKSYSGLQSKCPYCGARRSTGGKFSMPEPGDPKWRIAVGILLLVAVLCTAIGLVNINRAGGDSGNTNTAETSPSGTDDADVSSSPETSGVTPSDAAEPSPSPSAESIDSIIIKWSNYGGTNDMTIAVGTSIELTAEVYPTTADVEVTWSSENSSVCTVDESGNIKGVGSGKTTITAEYNGVEGTLIVRVK